MDYLEIFSLVVQTSTIRLVLDIVVAKDWSIKQLDISNAFLLGELQELVFMFQPAGFIDHQRPNHVCHLTKKLFTA